MNAYDTANIGAILADRSGTRFEWTNCWVLRFLDKMLLKGSPDLPYLYLIYPKQIEALYVYYGWPQEEINRQIKTLTGSLLFTIKEKST